MTGYLLKQIYLKLTDIAYITVISTASYKKVYTSYQCNSHMGIKL